MLNILQLVLSQQSIAISLSKAPTTQSSLEMQGIPNTIVVCRGPVGHYAITRDAMNKDCLKSRYRKAIRSNAMQELISVANRIRWQR